MQRDYKNDIQTSIEDLLGQICTRVEINKERDEIQFETDKGIYYLYHDQDCCESVSVEDITGDLQDLVGSPITLAIEVSSKEPPPDREADKYDSETWTFYKLATVKGYVDIRWYGVSNGYYSESVDFLLKPRKV